MYQAIGLLSILAFIIFAIMTLITLFRDRTKIKKYGLMSLASFCVLVVALSMDSENPRQSSAPLQAATGTTNSIEPAAIKSVEAEPKVEAAKVEALKVTAAELMKAYEKNEVSADNKFKDKQLLVTGTVASISKNFVDDIVISFSVSGSLFNVDAYLNEDQAEKASDLGKGERITVSCVGSGLIIGSPILKDCSIL